MSFGSVRVSAPSRVHFGLLFPGNGGDFQYGGAGVMVDEPRVEVTVTRNEDTRAEGPHAPRVLEFIRLWREHTRVSAAVRCHVETAPDEHVGLGLGTQLGLAVASALDTLFGRDDVTIEEKARSVGRGKRSAVGTYGFRDGGLIVERGKSPGQWLGRIHQRIELPATWRLLLTWPPGKAGLAGDAESSVFDRLPAVPESLGQALRDELFDKLVPAARRGDFESFSESVYRYGTLAGECFAAYQGGPFASPQIANMVAWLRQNGVAGVGQSSWGPTTFCWLPDVTTANQMAARIRNEFANFHVRLLVTSVARQGARVEVA